MTLAVVVGILALPAGAFATFDSNGGNNTSEPGTTGFYLALVVGVAAVGFVGWMALRNFLWSRRNRHRAEAVSALSGDSPAVQAARLEAAARRSSVDNSPQLVIRGPAAKPDVADELTKLANLRDRGALSQAEFDAQKAKLLTSE